MTTNEKALLETRLELEAELSKPKPKQDQGLISHLRLVESMIVRELDRDN